MTQPVEVPTAAKSMDLAPGALLGGFGDPVVPEFSPLLPASNADQTTTELANRFIDAEKIFLQFTPTSAGFNRFYQLLIQAHAAMMLDAARASSTYEIMEFITAHMAHVIADYAITSAHPANESFLREQLAKGGHTAVASILSSLSFSAHTPKQSPVRRTRGERIKRETGGKRGKYVSFLGGDESLDSVRHHSLGQTNDLYIAPTEQWGHRINVESMEGLGTGRSTSKISSNPSVRSTASVHIEPSKDLHSVDSESEPSSSCAGITGVGRIFRGKRPADDNPVIHTEEEGWYTERSARSEKCQQLSPMGKILHTWPEGYDASGKECVVRMYDRPSKGVLPTLNGPRDRKISSYTGGVNDNCLKSAPVRNELGAVHISKVNHVRGAFDTRKMELRSDGLFGRYIHRPSISGSFEQEYAQGHSIAKLFGHGSFGEKLLISENRTGVFGVEMEPVRENSGGSRGEESGILETSREHAQGEDVEQICTTSNNRETQLHLPSVPNGNVAGQGDAESSESVQDPEADSSRGGEGIDVVEDNSGNSSDSICSEEADNSLDKLGCIGHSSGIRSPSGKRESRCQNDTNESGGATASHQLQRAPSSEVCDLQQYRSYSEEKGDSVDGQCYSSSATAEERINESFPQPIGANEGDINVCGSSTDISCSQSRARAPKRRSGSTLKTVDRVGSATEDSGTYSSRDRAASSGSICIDEQCSAPPFRHKRVGHLCNGLERLEELDCSTNSPYRDSGGQISEVGISRSLSLPTADEESRCDRDPIVVQNQLGFKAFQRSLQDMEFSPVVGGGIFDGRNSARQLESEIANTIDRLARAVEFRSCTPGTQDKRIRVLTKFFQWCIKEARTVRIEDTIVLYCYRHLGVKSGEQVNREVGEILLCLKILGFEPDKSLKKRVQEIVKYCNLTFPPEKKDADPVTLQTIFELMDRADKQGITFVQGRALDILLIAYSTMARLHEIADLQPEDVLVDDKGIVRVNISTKQSVKTGLKVSKLVPKAMGEKSWCPRQILLEWLSRAKEANLDFVFANNKNQKPTVTSIDKALVAVLTKLMPEYKFRITGHSARKGSAMEACMAGLPEAFIQIQGGWADPTTCRKYMAGGWAKVESAFTTVELGLLE